MNIIIFIMIIINNTYNRARIINYRRIIQVVMHLESIFSQRALPLVVIHLKVEFSKVLIQVVRLK